MNDIDIKINNIEKKIAKFSTMRKKVNFSYSKIKDVRDLILFVIFDIEYNDTTLSEEKMIYYRNKVNELSEKIDNIEYKLSLTNDTQRMYLPINETYEYDTQYNNSLKNNNIGSRTSDYHYKTDRIILIDNSINPSNDNIKKSNIFLTKMKSIFCCFI